MSTKALFRQLTAGITFDTKKFSDDATKFGLIKKSEEKTQSDVKKVELPCLEKIKKEVKENIIKENIKENRSDSEDEITVFGNIKTSEKKKPKKKKKTKAKVSYIHRVGRTGRAGRDGQAITFFTEEDRTILRTIAQVMRNSGCYVPEYMLHMKKPSRDDRKQLVARAPKRDGITKESKYEKEERGKKEEMIAASRKRKQEAMGVSDLHTDKVVKSDNTC
eukprot:GFUD01118870.1.p1 GENE.GFUD01118870.1~~GFUD01118870.1.p1  ORF type:complete len:220 (-),score=77.66 GFUD01118870.1:32-691(-)